VDTLYKAVDVLDECIYFMMIMQHIGTSKVKPTTCATSHPTLHGEEREREREKKKSLINTNLQYSEPYLLNTHDTT